MKIIRLEKLERTLYVCASDSIDLLIDGKLVCARKITKVEKITRWAAVDIAGGTGYFVGDDGLGRELKRIARAANK